MNPDKIRNVLNILFLILALASIIVYIVARDDFKLFIYVCGAAIFVKLMELQLLKMMLKKYSYIK